MANYHLYYILTFFDVVGKGVIFFSSQYSKLISRSYFVPYNSWLKVLLSHDKSFGIFCFKCTVSVTARWSNRIIWPWRTFCAFSLRELSSKQGKAKRARGARESGTFLLPFLVSVKPHHHQRDFYSQFYF